MRNRILAFGAHPDDVEFGCGGTLILLRSLGYDITIIDLTRGEKSIHGRNDEDAVKAAKLLGAERINLNFGDKNVKLEDEYQLKKIKELIEKYKPSLVFVPYYVDPHPDHVNTSRLVNKFTNPIYYYISHMENENWGVDISKVYKEKIKLLQCHEMQAKPEDWEWIENRNKESGDAVGSEKGELFHIEDKKDLPDLFKKIK
ncbi:MAG TPA: hypothetical protein ENH99_02035 [Candidatus Pacearchaeota archaeon]|nr:hypothetical protein [Candidatus Pacearchaeota archaeon]